MSKKILVFDFFGVICSEIAPYWLQEHFSPEEAIRIKGEIVTLADTGTISQDELFRELAKLANTTPEKALEEWCSLVKIDSAVVGLIADLEPMFRIALLTNSPSPFVRGIMNRHGLESLFEHVLVSSEERIAKPDPRVFHRMLTRLSVQPNDAVMIDDNPSNIAGAESMGMRGILFKSASQLRQKILDMSFTTTRAQQNERSER